MAKVQDVGFVKPAPSIFDPQQELDIKRKRAMAEQMMKAGEQPTGTETISGVAVKQSPLAAMARAIQQGVGGYQAGQADKSEADMSTSRQQRLAQAIQSGKLDSLASGSPEEQILALKSQMDIQGENRKFAHDLELAKKKASGGGGGATGALADRLIAQGVDPIAAILIAKSGVDHGTTIKGRTVSALDGAPETFGTIAGAKQDAKNTSDLEYAAPTAKASAQGKAQGEAAGAYDKKALQAQDNEQVINQILQKDQTGKDLLDRATGSGLGNVLAVGKQIAGVSDESTQANSQLEVLGGQLLNNVPRMEGPQSDADVRSYKEQAGKIANRNIPAGDKRAALQAIGNIKNKYAHLNGGTEIPNQTPIAPATKNWIMQGGKLVPAP